MAKLYVYYNLHKSCWSIMYRGKVVAHATALLLEDCTYRVRESGRSRTLIERRKQVHAFVVAERILFAEGLRYTNHGECLDIGGYTSVPKVTQIGGAYYNPFRVANFVDAQDHSKVLDSDQYVYMDNQRKVHRMAIAQEAAA